MRKLRNLSLYIIIIAVIILAGIKALLWYYTEKTAKDIQNALPPGAFSYSGITTSLKGSTSLNNISLLINGQSVRIEKIELTSNNIFELLLLIAKNWGSKIPKELTLKISGVHVNISSLIDNTLETEFLNQPPAIPCGKIRKITASDYPDIGYVYFLFDFDIGYKKISNTRTQLDINLAMRDGLQASLSFYGNSTIISTPSSNRKAFIPEFSLDIKNNILQRKLYAYCAKQENTPLIEYLDNLSPYFTREKLDKETVSTLELTLSDNVIDALNQYQKDPNSLYLSITPKGSISFNELKNMSEKSVLEIVQPTLKINGKNIPIQFEWTTLEAFARKSMQANSKNTAPIIQSAERILTPVNELNKKAFNRKIEIHTNSGRIYKGAFKKVEGDSLYMAIHKSWGTSDLKLKTDTILLVYILSDF